MVRRLLVVLALAVIPFVAMTTAAPPGAGAAPPGPIQGCMNGGWQTITEASGQPFANEGRCIGYAIHNPVSLDDLASSSVSGSDFEVGGCSFVGSSLVATFPGSSAVGPVTLRSVGCIPEGEPGFPLVLSYAGTFAITSGVGTLSGSAAGQINNEFTISGGELPVATSETLALTATSGTGLFTGTTGVLSVSLQFPTPGSLGFVGTVTPA